MTCSGMADDILKCSLGIINKTSRLVHETCLVTLHDLIDEAVSGALGCDSLLCITIGLSSCDQCQLLDSTFLPIKTFSPNFPHCFHL